VNRNDILEACRLSKHFFFENYYYIPDIINGGVTKLDLRDYQEDILADIEENRNIVGS
jgi:hypothetical protein